MNRNNKIAIKLAITSIGFLILVRIRSFLDLEYNIFINDKYDIIGNIVWYAAGISFYVLITSVLFLLFGFIKMKFAKK